MRSRSRPARRWLAALLAALVASGCSSATGTSPVDPAAAATDESAIGVFDATVLHEIAVSFEQADYDAILDTYAETGEKDWLQVDVTIDGIAYQRVGMRLKGNSSLMGLRRDADGSSAAAPETLPWLLRLDRYVDGQTHQGYADIVIRSNSTETSLNEAVALTLLDEAGLASQDAAPASVSVNGSDPVLRLIVEHPNDDAWERAAFDDPGALYKAEATGDWSYRGDDPDAYTDVFDQESGDDLTDLTPLIEFLDFINTSDDETFAAELPERLDVDAFATYLAMMDLIENSDDIDGPGNNAYLWWDADTGQFTVVPWDMNLAFGGFGRGPGGGPGGGGFAGRGGPPDGAMPEGELPARRAPDGRSVPGGEFPGGTPPEGGFPGDGAPPEGGFPDGGGPPEGGFPDGGGPPEGGFPGGGPRGGRSNPLVERFHANEEFEALYQQRLTELRAELFDSGIARDILDGWVDVLTTQATHLVDADTITAEAETLRARIAG